MDVDWFDWVVVWLVLETLEVVSVFVDDALVEAVEVVEFNGKDVADVVVALF